MRISDRGEVLFLLEVRAFNEQRAPTAAKDPFLCNRSGRRAHTPTRATTAQLYGPAVVDFARAGTSIVEPRISLETARDRWRRVHAVVSRCVWFVPFRHRDGFGDNRSAIAGAAAAGFSAARKSATTHRSDHD